MGFKHMAYNYKFSGSKNKRFSRILNILFISTLEISALVTETQSQKRQEVDDTYERKKGIKSFLSTSYNKSYKLQ